MITEQYTEYGRKELAMKKYRVWFTFRNELGEWVEDYLDDSGKGFEYEEALDVAREMLCRGHINVQVKEL